MSLAPGFEALEPFVARWALASSAARDQLRGASMPEERQAFYDVAQPLLPYALEHLDAQPFDALGEGDRKLMNLMLSLAHVTIAVELQREDEPAHALTRAYIPITRSVGDI